MNKCLLFFAAIPLYALLSGCSPQPSSRVTLASPQVEAPETLPEGKGLRVLYLGNSLTFYNDLPALVQAMASAGGVELHWLASTIPNANLEDQWNHPRARELLAKHRWDYVVMQQGPSSQPASQLDIKKWSGIWAEAIRQRGAKPALYMVWPVHGQWDGFKLVSQSYRNAATASKALIFPAGEAWKELLKDKPASLLYDADGLHPSPGGSYLAALIITYGLTGVEPEKAPSQLRLASGKLCPLPEADAASLRQAAARVIARMKEETAK